MAILKPDSTVLSNAILHSSSTNLAIEDVTGSDNNVVKVLSVDSNQNLIFTDVSPLTVYSYFTVQFQGQSYGYASGGYPNIGRIDKFPFTTDSPSSYIGTLSTSRYDLAGQSSTSHGYGFGGSTGPSTGSQIIDKFPFSSDTSATSTGGLTYGSDTIGATGQSSRENGYATNGSVIHRFPFSSDTNATTVGNQSDSRRHSAGQSSDEHGYATGGSFSGPISTIDRFPFSSDSGSTDVGELLIGRYLHGGQSSTTHGYNVGGAPYSPGPTYTSHIEKFSFSSNANGSGVGGLVGGDRQVKSSQSSTDSGYASGGFGNASVNTIEKFPFSSDTNSTDVGELTTARSSAAGHQI